MAPSSDHPKDPEKAAPIPFDPEHHEQPQTDTDIHSVSDGSDSHDKHHDDIEAQRAAHVNADQVLPMEENIGGVLSRSQSRASSTRVRPAVIVPREKRRGLFGRLGLIPEVERPVDYLRSTKWTITLVVAAATAAAPLGSSIFFRTSTHLLSLYSHSYIHTHP